MTDVPGLLTGFFQVAYVTNDIDRARRDLGTRFAFERIIELPTEIEVEEAGAKGISRAKAFLAGAYGGGPIVEVLQPLGGCGTLLSAMLEGAREYTVRLHHLGVRVNDIDGLRESLRTEGLDYFQYADLAGVRAAFIDPRHQLGHFIEALEFTDEGWAMIESLRAAPHQRSRRPPRRA